MVKRAVSVKFTAVGEEIHQPLLVNEIVGNWARLIEDRKRGYYAVYLT
jgi:hypothetical protein